MGRENADPLLTQAAQRDRKDRCRRFVEPLEVIQRQNDRTSPRQLDQDIQHAESNRPRVNGGSDVVAQEQRQLQGLTSWRRDLIRNHVEYRSDQIYQRRERKLALGLDASVLEYPIADLPAQLNGGLP